MLARREIAFEKEPPIEESTEVWCPSAHDNCNCPCSEACIPKGVEADASATPVTVSSKVNEAPSNTSPEATPLPLATTEATYTVTAPLPAGGATHSTSKVPELQRSFCSKNVPSIDFVQPNAIIGILVVKHARVGSIGEYRSAVYPEARWITGTAQRNDQGVCGTRHVGVAQGHVTLDHHKRIERRRKRAT